LKPKILLLGEYHDSVENHKNQASEVLNFKPEVCFMEMYTYPNDSWKCKNFSERSLKDLRRDWEWSFGDFDAYLPLIKAVREVKAEVRPLTPQKINVEKDPIGNRAMKEIICRYSGGYSKIAVIVGILHLTGEKDEKGVGLVRLLEDDFAAVLPEYLKEHLRDYNRPCRLNYTAPRGRKQILLDYLY
jgi:hypothetical protein